MGKIAAVFVFIILILSALSGHCIEGVGKRMLTGLSQSTTSGAYNQQVLNIILDKIEGGFVYSQDGRRFQMTSTAKVIDNAQGKSKIRIAELIFIQGMLVSVHIK